MEQPRKRVAQGRSRESLGSRAPLQTRDHDTEPSHCRQGPNIIFVLKALCQTIIPAPMHARWLVWQIHLRLWVDLFGDLAHCVQGTTDPIQGLRLIAHARMACSR
jgi:hypothetical protein